MSVFCIFVLHCESIITQYWPTTSWIRTPCNWKKKKTSKLNHLVIISQTFQFMHSVLVLLIFHILFCKLLLYFLLYAFQNLVEKFILDLHVRSIWLFIYRPKFKKGSHMNNEYLISYGCGWHIKIFCYVSVTVSLDYNLQI
jgi:hypothetical protein